MKSTKIKIAGISAAAAALVGGGAAIAADRLSPEAESDAVVADAAKQLGVDASKLDAALKKALANRVDAAVEAGQITKAQGDEMKARIAAGEVPLVGVGRGPGHHRFGHHSLASLDAAATYLGVTEAELTTSLSDGSTLAEIAEEEGKSVDGLKDALVAAAKADLADAVEDGRLTAAQQAKIVADLPDRIDDLVNGELGHKRFERGPGFGGPASAARPSADASGGATPSRPPTAPARPSPGRGGRIPLERTTMRTPFKSSRTMLATAMTSAALIGAGSVAAVTAFVDSDPAHRLRQVTVSGDGTAGRGLVDLRRRDLQEQLRGGGRDRGHVTRLAAAAARSRRRAPASSTTSRAT